MRILQVRRLEDIKQIMREIRVDPYGIEIMLPKAVPYLIKLDSVSNITANILKQEMLSLGGDAAVARDALTGRTKKTNCLLIGNFSQFNRLSQKLNKQPFGLNKLAESLIRILNNYQREEFALNIGRYKLNVGKRAHIMGVVNLTPDSFSGDGLYKGQGKLTLANIVKRVKRLVKDGADIIDVGGESSRPGARPVSVKEELKRIVPVIKILSKNIPVPISVDTYKPEVARQALENGAVIVNDITGLKDLKMAKAVARYKAGVVIMHMRGNPRVMQKNLKYGSLIEEITDYLDKAIDRAQEAGIGKEKIVIDPGIGFGKSADHNLEILKRLREFKVLGRPILVGTSRKAFIRKILGMQGQTIGTVSSCVLAAESGANIVRVHDVKEVKQALVVLEKIRNVRYPH